MARKYKINNRLKIYNQDFFDFNNYKTANFIRVKHRLVGWYLLNRFNLQFALKYLAKHTNLIQILSKEFKQYIPEIENFYNITFITQKQYLKSIILNGDIICKNCAKRSIKGNDFCSIKCANDYNKINTGVKISKSLKNHYMNMDKETKDIKNKNIAKGILKTYNTYTDDIKQQKFTNTKLRYTAFDNFNKLYPELKLLCTKEYFYKNKFLPVQCKCGNIFDIYKSTTYNARCKKCNPILKNKTQTEIETFINSFNIKTKSNDRTIIKPLELDIFVPDYNFGIEYNGIPDHSFGISKYDRFNNIMLENQNIHLDKTELCENQNIQLFQINEYEWNTSKKDIWKSIIVSKLGLSTRIFARKCIIKEVSSKESSIFMNKNHLQGNRGAKIRIGLYYKNKLVQIMTFGTPLYNKKYEYELIRLCSKLNLTIIGGASKLLKYFERTYNPKSLLSYANRRLSTGTVYEKCGFKYIKKTKPGYILCKLNDPIIYGRTNFQKHKLKTMFSNFDSTKTAKENILNNGFRYFYDCGNLLYTKDY